MREVAEKTEKAIFAGIKAHLNCLYNALPEIRLEGGDNITTH